MLKHKLVEARVPVSKIDMISLQKDELVDYIKSELANRLADTIIENNIGILTSKDSSDDYFNMDYTLSMVVISPQDYKELRDAIFINDFKTIKDGNIIPLIDLL